MDMAKFFNVDINYLARNTRYGKIAKEVNDRMLEQKEVMDWVLERVNPRIAALEKRVEELEAKLG
jgi:hypothetical protein